jgi:phospholipase C
VNATRRTPGKSAKKAKPPIEHVVIIVKENHGFDNYFGSFHGANGAQLPRSLNPPPHDPDHTHGAWLTRAATAVRAQFVEQDIPAYFAYAREFTLCDNYFSEIAGPSTPNHLMLIAADSPIFVNPPRYRLAPGEALFDLPSLPIALEKKGLSWRNYGGYAFDFIKALQAKPKYTSQQFARDAAKGRLPSVSWVYAPHALSEHAPDPPDAGTPVGNVTFGMQWTVDQVNAVVQGGLWPKTAIFVTWDDWGGWSDHVDPPNVEQWKHDPQHPDRDGNHPKWDGTQFRYGSRVGCLVLGAYAKKGHVSKVRHSHVSLLRFCETLFGLPPLNARTAAASGMSDCFDFNRKPSTPPPGKPA